MRISAFSRLDVRLHSMLLGRKIKFREQSLKSKHQKSLPGPLVQAFIMPTLCTVIIRGILTLHLRGGVLSFLGPTFLSRSTCFSCNSKQSFGRFKTALQQLLVDAPFSKLFLGVGLRQVPRHLLTRVRCFFAPEIAHQGFSFVKREESYVA